LPIHGGDRDASRHDCVSQTQFSSSTEKWEDNLRSGKFWQAFRRLVHCRASDVRTVHCRVSSFPHLIVSQRTFYDVEL
jgi:hypothetical protein